MASIITPSNLTVTITESYQVNEVAYGNEITKTFTGQGKVDQRVMSIAISETGATDIIGFGAADDQGEFIVADYTYFRITNLDDTNFVTLQITSGDTYWIKLKAGESFMLMDNEMDAIASSTVYGAFADITGISAGSDTAIVEIEYVMVTA
tara:strand:+ start:1704 stop:2156 length:453 start_codon:yes stop_codon:yes gene_type:complete